MLVTNFSSVYFLFASPFNNEKQVEFQCWGVRTGYLLNQRHLDSYHEHLRGFGSSAPAEIEMANASDSVEEFAIKNEDPEMSLINQSLVDEESKASGYDKKTDEYLNEEFEDCIRMYVM